MTDNMPETSVSKLHKTLLRIAKIAGVAAWVLSILYMMIYSLSTINSLNYLLSANGLHSISDFISIAYPTFISILATTIQKLFLGVVLWLILQAVSLGLRQLVETNVNYRSAVSGGAHE